MLIEFYNADLVNQKFHLAIFLVSCFIILASTISNSPLSIFLWLILLSIFISCLLTTFSSARLMRRILFLRIVGGLLVLFTFILRASLTSKMKTPNLPLILSFIFLPIFFSNSPILTKTSYSPFTSNLITIILLLILLNLSLSLVSKILINPLSPIKSNLY